ncbi:hypothetical protein SRRS_01410 [Sporomusa rhizae]
MEATSLAKEQFLFPRRVHNREDKKYNFTGAQGEYSELLLVFQKNVQNRTKIQEEFVSMINTYSNILRERNNQVAELITAMTTKDGETIM